MTINFQSGDHPPELAVCWYLGQILATGTYLNIFIQKYIGLDIHIEKAAIVREKSYGNKRIDLCIYITDINDNKYGIVIEAKTHWPDDEQLQASVDIFSHEHDGYKSVYGLHFLSTIENKQLDALDDHHWKFQIVKIKELLKSFCENGIEAGHSLRWASDLHQLLKYKKS